MLSDNQKIGVGLSLAGVVFVFLGILLFFDRGLITLGNLLFITGVPLAVGVERTISLFRTKPIQSLVYFTGIILILFKITIVGFALEIIGALTIFGPFARIALDFLQHAPVIGPLINRRREVIK